MKRFPSAIWNISEISEEDLAGRTNNPLERYNRRLNSLFPNAHPRLIQFVTIIKDEDEHYTILTECIRSGKLEFPLIDRDFIMPSIPDDLLHSTPVNKFLRFSDSYGFRIKYTSIICSNQCSYKFDRGRLGCNQDASSKKESSRSRVR